MQPIRSILDIPFRRRAPMDLLNLHDRRDAPDLEYYDYGYARTDIVYLDRRRDPEPLPVVRDALLLALHSADDAEPMKHDIELEFFIDEVAEDYSVTVLLSDFLQKWLPPLSSDERALVLVLCNPHGATIHRPAIVGSTPLWYAMGDVESWLDMDQTSPRIRLVADTWQRAD